MRTWMKVVRIDVKKCNLSKDEEVLSTITLLKIMTTQNEKMSPTLIEAQKEDLQSFPPVLSKYAMNKWSIKITYIIINVCVPIQATMNVIVEDIYDFT